MTSKKKQRREKVCRYMAYLNEEMNYLSRRIEAIEDTLNIETMTKGAIVSIDDMPKSKGVKKR